MELAEHWQTAKQGQMAKSTRPLYEVGSLLLALYQQFPEIDKTQ
jgi:hypothetical protein